MELNLKSAHYTFLALATEGKPVTDTTNVLEDRERTERFRAARGKLAISHAQIRKKIELEEKQNKPSTLVRRVANNPEFIKLMERRIPHPSAKKIL